MAALYILLFSISGFGQTATAGLNQGERAKHNPPVNEGYVTGADGVRLFYRKVGRGRRVAVFLHGGPGSNFRGQGDYMEQLAEGRTVIMYDQRGSGLSQLVTDPQLLTSAHHVRDLDALRHHFGIRRMTIIGLSWGAGLAAMYATEHHERG